MNYLRQNLRWIAPCFAILCTIIIFSIYLLTASIDINEEKTYINIYPHTNRKDIIKIIKSQNVVINSFAFNFYSFIFNYNTVYSGHYELKNGMKIYDLVHKLSKGRQTAIRLVIGKSRTKYDFAEKISNEFAFSKQEMLSKMNDNKFLKPFNIDSISVLSLFIPNTYNIYWNISVEGFFKRMYRESDLFWKKRDDKLQKIGLDRLAVMVIASIVEEETNKDIEKPLIAGVYINRLKKGMLLQADPTVRYALGDFSITRITGNMLGIDSPYNTYRNQGLPPSPICIPSIASIDAVLNYAENDYLFFCAKEDFSGFHNFSSTYQEHLSNARRYQIALDSLESYSL